MAGLIFLWQQAATAPTPLPPLMGVDDFAPPPVRHHRGRGMLVLRPVVGHGSGRTRRSSITRESQLPAVAITGGGRIRRSGSGALPLAEPTITGAGRLRRTGHGEIALALMRTRDRDALVALASLAD